MTAWRHGPLAVVLASALFCGGCVSILTGGMLSNGKVARGEVKRSYSYPMFALADALQKSLNDLDIKNPDGQLGRFGGRVKVIAPTGERLQLDLRPEEAASTTVRIRVLKSDDTSWANRLFDRIEHHLRPDRSNAQAVSFGGSSRPSE